MIGDMRWHPQRYQFSSKLVKDERTRCGCLVLHKRVDVNPLGETREDVEADDREDFEDECGRVGL